MAKKAKKLAIHSINLNKNGLESVISSLEVSIINYLWAHEPSTVRDIHGIVGKEKDVALTTIGVTLDRMYAKGLVGREVKTGRGGLKYIYSAGPSKEEFGRSVAKEVVEKLSSTFGSSFASYFDGIKE